jgi:hypothetical protein
MSFHPHNLRTCGVAIVAALFLPLAGCTNASPGATGVVGGPASLPASADSDPLAGAPGLRTCYELTLTEADAVTNDNPGVGCFSPHTAMTYHVGSFSADAVTADSAAAIRACERKLPAAVGLSRREVKASILSWIWFEPSTAQWSAGARWYRCDVVVRRGNGSFKPLPSGPPPFFHGSAGSDGSAGSVGRVPDEYFRCIRERGKVGVPVTCDKAHGYRWAGTFEGTGTRRPSQAKLLEQANRRCYALTGTRTWWVTWPNKDSWAAGDHEMACYKETRS